MQKGNTLLIILIMILAAGVGYVLFSLKGRLNLNPATSNTQNYTLPVTSPEAGNQTAANTSDKISLSISSPANGATLSSAKVTVSGKTSPNAEVFINDQSTTADASGNFSLNLTLDEGSNNLVVSANDAEGNVAEQNLTVTVESFK